MSGWVYEVDEESQWDYVIQEVRLYGWKDKFPERFATSGSTLPEIAEMLRESGDEALSFSK
jgi:hypothetical protein